MEEKKVLSTDEIKSKLLNDYNQKKSDVIYPYEVVDLPSKGLMYTDEYLSTGQLKMKYPTAKEENILTSVNLIQKNIVIDKFIESIILDPINFDDLLLVDKNSLMIDARILAYGSEYLANGTCPHCSEVKPITIDLSTTIKFPDLDEELYKNGNSFTFTLPRLKKVVEFNCTVKFAFNTWFSQIKCSDKCLHEIKIPFIRDVSETCDTKKPIKHSQASKC